MGGGGLLAALHLAAAVLGLGGVQALPGLEVGDGGLVGQQHGGGAEHEECRVVEEVEETAGVDVRVSHHLGSEERLPRARPEQGPRGPVGHLHAVDGGVEGAFDGSYVGLLVVALVHVAVEQGELLVEPHHVGPHLLLAGPDTQLKCLSRSGAGSDRSQLYLVVQLRHDEESSPATDLLTLDDIAVDVISNVEDILALGPHQLGEDLAAAPAVDGVLVELVPHVLPNTELPGSLVHSPKDGALGEKQRLSGVNKGVVKIRLPGLT